MGEISSAPLLSSMRPEVARERIKSFGEYFGLAHLYFAQHAAFPMALTSDLLYRLWANFQRDTSDKKLHIPWIAVADLLLSPLCEEVGYELFEMDVAVRVELLNALKIHPGFGQRRLNELSHFLLDYVRQQLHSNTPSTRDFAQAQRWTALAYTLPAQAASELADALKSLHRTNRVEQIRMVSLMETLDKLADPLAALEGFVPLLTYARGVGQLARGDVEGARVLLSTVKEAEQIEQATGIRLPAFEQWLEGEGNVAPQVQSSRKDFSISYANADRTWAEWIAWQLEAAGYSTEFQAWDFRPGSSFALEMEKAASEAERTLVVLSPNYLNAPFTKAEWEAAFYRDSTREQGVLLPIQVRECEPQLTGQLGSISYINLVGVNDESKAIAILLAGTQHERAKPIAPAPYPRDVPHLLPERPPFPNAPLPSSSQIAKVLSIFYCYAREDSSLRDELERHLSGLKRRRQIQTWHDREIQPGSDWRHEIDTHLNRADIILLLVSPDFMASDYCYGIEMKRALERHKAGDARVIPIILRPVEWKQAPFSQLQVFPTNALPVTLWRDRNEAFLDISRRIGIIIEELLTSPETKDEVVPINDKPAGQKSYRGAATVLLIRNGESQSDAGLPTTSPERIELTALGIKQAESIAQYLQSQLYPDLIVTSSYVRTKQTATPTKLLFPEVPEEEWPVHEFTYLSSEEFRGLSTMEDRRPLVETYWEICDPTYVDGPGAESFDQFIGRVRDVIKRLKETSHDTIAIFSHEQFIRALLWLSQEDSLKLDSESMRDFRDVLRSDPLPNGAISRMQFSNQERWVWELITSHLERPGRYRAR